MRPAIGEINNGSASCDLLSRLEAINQDLALQSPLSDVSKGKSEWVLDEQGARGLKLLGNLFHQRKGDG